MSLFLIVFGTLIFVVSIILAVIEAKKFDKKLSEHDYDSWEY